MVLYKNPQHCSIYKLLVQALNGLLIVQLDFTQCVGWCVARWGRRAVGVLALCVYMSYVTGMITHLYYKSVNITGSDRGYLGSGRIIGVLHSLLEMSLHTLSCMNVNKYKKPYSCCENHFFPLSFTGPSVIFFISLATFFVLMYHNKQLIITCKLEEIQPYHAKCHTNWLAEAFL